MLEELQAMSPGELAAAANGAGMKVEGSKTEVLADSILRRLGQTVGNASGDAASIDSDCLRYLCEQFRLPAPTEANGLPAEDRVFAPLLVQAARVTLPIWRLGGHMAALNVQNVRQGALDVMDRLSRRVLPVDEALAVISQEEARLPSVGAVMSGLDMAARLDDDLAAIAGRRDWIEVTLLMCLALAMSDGKFHKEEERYYLTVAQRLGLDLDRANDLREKTITSFWALRARLAPPGTEAPPEVKTNSLKAAYNTFEHVGAFRTLSAIIRAACVAAAWGENAPKPAAWPTRLLARFSSKRDPGVPAWVLDVALMAYIQTRQRSGPV